MPKPLSLLFVMFSAILLFAPTVFAQPPVDSLNGKTIHLYVESDEFTAFYFQNGDVPFTSPSKYHYSLTLAGVDIYQQDFFMTSNGNGPAGEHFSWKFGKTGLNRTAEGRLTVADFQGKDTMWIIVDPAGPLTAPPIITLVEPRVLNILNPWPATAPKLVWGGNKTRKMTTTPGRCGWFTTLIVDPAFVSGHFAEINNEETYGLAGFGSSADFDFTALSATQGKSLWFNTQTNAWTPAWPNVHGECQYMLAVSVRDFSARHPDFDFGAITGDFTTQGMVQPIIGADRRPVSTGKSLRAPMTYGLFDKWWVTDSTNADSSLRSYESCVDIPMSKSSDGLWEYDSYRDSPADRSFFPAEADNRHPEESKEVCVMDNSEPPIYKGSLPGVRRNGNFCVESHASFIYKPGQTFTFRGDDDVWVFINDKLVVDLGGVHTPKSDTVALDTLGLTAGSQYKWDLFLCDRQPCTSTLRFKSSIYFKQQRALFVNPVPAPNPGTVSQEILKGAGGKGSCASTGAVETKATDLSYQLLDATGTVVETLGNGTFHGGITIANSIVTVDTSKLTTTVLVPGATYRVVAFEPANAQIKVEIPFRVPGSSAGLIRRKVPAGKHGALPFRNVLGRKVRAFPDRIHSPLIPQKDLEAVKK